MSSSLANTSSPDELSAAVGAEISSCVPAFTCGGEFTVGAEEELLLVDVDDRLLSGDTDDLVDALDDHPRGVVCRELYGAEIEFASAIGRGGEEVGDSLRDFRRSLLDAGGRPLAVGLHPAGGFGDVGLTDDPRYEQIGQSLAGLLRTPTAALQVHVGMPDATSAVAAMRGLRHHLALFRALTCSSPYWHGRDSGLASARWAVVRSYPRGGPPPVVRSWDEYLGLMEAIAAAAEVPDYTHIWWDLRAQPRFGTVEVRVMDSQPSLFVAAAMVSLVQGLARYAVERPLAVDVPTEVLDENDFRVARHGLEARIVDVDGTMRTIRELASRAVAEARAVLRPDGLDAPLAGIGRLLEEEPECDRQRRIHGEHGMAGLLRDLTTRTAAVT